VNFRYPIFLDVRGQNCLVTGEGFEIAGKVEALVRASALVTYVNPTAVPSIEALAAANLIRWERRKFRTADLRHCFLVIADTEANPRIFRAAEKRRILCNCVDDPSNCRFSFGSIHRQGELTIAISTNGRAPAVAVRLKQQLQKEVGPEYAALLAMLKVVRPMITKSTLDFEARRKLWYQIVDSPILNLLKDQQWETAGTTLFELMDAAISSTSHFDTCAESAHR
jgi:precorrin-2 dehydrogenase / sirohydrochlorin ferrochelatase